MSLSTITRISMFLTLALVSAGCTVATTTVAPATVGQVENARPTAAPRLLCQTAEQAREAAGRLTRQQLIGFSNVPLNSLPSGCTRNRPRGDAVSVFAGSVTDRDGQWRMALIELYIPEPAGSPFQPTLFAFTIDPLNARLTRR